MSSFIAQNATLNREMQAALFDSFKDITRSTRRPIGIPAPLEGAKPMVTQFLQYVKGISLKFSPHNCNTSMALDLWLKDLRMPDAERDSSMNADEKLRLWEVTHSLVDKALLVDTLPAVVHSFKGGLKLLNEVFEPCFKRLSILSSICIQNAFIRFSMQVWQFLLLISHNCRVNSMVGS